MLSLPIKPLQKILIIQTAFIGDAILASSVVEKLHAHYPAAQIDLMVRKGNEGLYQQHPFLHEVLVWNKQEGKYRSLLRLLRQLRSTRYDAVINLHRYASSGMLTAFSGATYTAGFANSIFSRFFTKRVKHVIGDGRHETDRYNELISDITDLTVCRPRLYPTEAHQAKVQSLKTGTYVCMAPSSVWFTKQLPEEKWVELAQKLPTDTRIYFLGAKGDAALCQRIIDQSGHSNSKVLAGELNLLESCALMKDAQMNYVNDSAPLHLASSVNAPVTAFFCSTVPSFGFTPLSDNSTIAEVIGLPCRPCGLHGYKACPLGHFKCGREMEVGRNF